MSTRLRRVRECDREGFKQDYRFTTSRTRTQSSFEHTPDHTLWIPEFDEEIWEWTRGFPKLGSMAVVGQGMRYRGRSSIKKARTIETKPFPGSLEGYHVLKGRWPVHKHPPVCYFNPEAALVGRPRSGLDRLPQVLVNYAPTSRGKWRLKPFIDYTGRVFSGSLFCVRPRDSRVPLEFLWAVMLSPLANLFARTHLLKRHVLTGTMEALFQGLTILLSIGLPSAFGSILRWPGGVSVIFLILMVIVRAKLKMFSFAWMRKYFDCTTSRRTPNGCCWINSRVSSGRAFHSPSPHTTQMSLLRMCRFMFICRTPSSNLFTARHLNSMLSKSSGMTCWLRNPMLDRSQIRKKRNSTSCRRRLTDATTHCKWRKVADRGNRPEHPRLSEAKLKRLDDSLASAALEEARDS